MTGAELIAAERERQVSVEGWTPEHDDSHDLGELAMAAATYALWASEREFRWFIEARDHTNRRVSITRPCWVRRAIACFEWAAKTPRSWPFPDGFKPTPGDRVRELTKAGALIAAEIDRLQRAQHPSPPTEPSA
jgi:hypothetical protein